MVPGKKSLAVAALSLCGLGNAQQNITSDDYFYGQSPPVYPSPNITGTGDWATAYQKAAALVAQLTLEEKNNLTYGIETTDNGCAGNIGAIPRVGFPGLCLQDAGNGVRATDFVNSYPAGLHAAASWNKTLAYERGWHMAGEFKTKGVQVALGPVVAPLGRLTTNGRNWEGGAADPYLSGAIGAATVEGTQDRGVMSSVKHFIGYEQELYRNPTINDAGEIAIQSISSNIDDKTLHELYLWPFQDTLKSGAANIMCSYNRLNNSYACQNSKALNGLLKTELGFQGFVVTDWGGQHSGVASALAGLDMTMPTGNNLFQPGEHFWGPHFTTAINNGSVPLSRLDDMATRILAAWYKLGQDSPEEPTPGIGMPFDISGPHEFVSALTNEAKPTLWAGALEGHVLVKNDGALPLKCPKLISVFGYDAIAPPQFIPNNAVASDPWELGFEPAFFQLDVLPNSPHIVDAPAIDQVALNGTLSVGGGSGGNAGPYLSAPLDALQQRAYQDNTMVQWDTSKNLTSLGGNRAAEACLVFINAFATEGVDRPGTYDSYSDNLVAKVASNCSNTIVIIHNAGVRLVESFVDNPNVTAIVYAHLPGQYSGRAITSLLYGDDNFSGKLPYTVAKNETDFPAYWHSYGEAPYQEFPQSDFNEGVFIDYRHFDAHNITPRYEFGFGLSYTTFGFSDVQVSCLESGLDTYPSGHIEQGGAVDLWDNIANVTATVTNTGSVTGSEVAQLYVGIPGGPVRQLRGFEKVMLAPGASSPVTFPLTRRDLSTWDVVAQKWELQSGSYHVYVGSSSRDLPLTASFQITTSSS
ncbi:hypothetical protein N7468_000975 [Penicillium chermesinum]|uniref:beta-glucosidase n=1 Tax=Penicillium chermesinum TaxID=63820 RepID=A0A9W9TWL0_9EURO|nr:uncharacterized protein N7468_000975 [Penicillium chermesinum]KAJ5245992.1 hypothetical protein N7468_000975 [Penicillium chermesinum]